MDEKESLNLPAIPAWVESVADGRVNDQGSIAQAAGALSLFMDQITRGQPRWFGALQNRLTLDASIRYLDRGAWKTTPEKLRDAIHFRGENAAGPAADAAIAIDAYYRRRPSQYVEATSALLSALNRPEMPALPTLENRHTFTGAVAVWSELQNQTEAPVLADVIGDMLMARIWNWPQALPMLAITHVNPVNPLLSIVKSMRQIVRTARRFETAHERMTAAAKNIRTKKLDEALGVIGARESVTPHDLSKLNPRSARRLLDSLVERKVLVRLTEREHYQIHSLCL